MNTTLGLLSSENMVEPNPSGGSASSSDTEDNDGSEEEEEEENSSKKRRTKRKKPSLKVYHSPQESDSDENIIIQQSQGQLFIRQLLTIIFCVLCY